MSEKHFSPFNPVDEDKLPRDIAHYLSGIRQGYKLMVDYVMSEDGTMWKFYLDDDDVVQVSPSPEGKALPINTSTPVSFVPSAGEPQEVKGPETHEPVDEDISPQAVRVMAILDEARDLFLQKNKGYGDTAYFLGAKGQYSDIYRKVGKLKHTLWDGHPIPEGSESNEEMLMDLIGHCLLTIDFIRTENQRNGN